MEKYEGLQSWNLELIRKHEGRHSEISECHSHSRSRRVIVKRISDDIEDKPARAAILREFESLQMVRNYLPEQLRNTVPEPLMVLPETKELVVEAMQGRPLSWVLKRQANRLIGPLRLQRMSDLGRMAGRWLLEFHRTTKTKPMPHDSAKFMAWLEERFENCARNGVASSTVSAFRRMISQASSYLDGVPLPSAALQGDFLPQNILVQDNGIAVVDFESFHERYCTYQDVSIFVTYVRALSAFPYYSQKALRTLADSFLHAYGVSGDELPLRLYRAQSIVLLISELNMNRANMFARRRLELLQAQLQRVCAVLPGLAAAA